MTFELVLIAVAITLEPIPLTAFLVLLASKRGQVKGAAFVFGWLASLAVVAAVTILATGNDPPKPNTNPSLAALAFKIAAGVVLLLVAERQRRKMGRPKPPKKPPKWQTRVDTMSPWAAVGIAALVQPWGLVAIGVADIVEAKVSNIHQSVAIIVFCVVATGTYLAMELYALARPRQCQDLMDRIRAWIDTHTDQVIVIGALLLGLWLIGKSTYLLAT